MGRRSATRAALQGIRSTLRRLTDFAAVGVRSGGYHFEFDSQFHQNCGASRCRFVRNRRRGSYSLWLEGRIGVTEPQTSTAVVLGHAAAAVSEATVALRDLQ
jgi:hypothetical protein